MIAEAEANNRGRGQRTLLSALRTGQQGVITSLDGGHNFRSRVANLGFTVGAEVTMRQNYGHGPVLIAVRGTLLALGRREAAYVWVEAGE